MKANLDDQAGRGLLRKYAEEFDCQLWRSDDLAYLLPSVEPFIPGPHGPPSDEGGH